MKKTFITAALGLLLALTSCSKDDDKVEAPSLIGKWENVKQGTLILNQEVLTDYEHTTGCTKDFTTFTATTSVMNSFTGSACTKEVETSTYTRNGNALSLVSEGETLTGEIKILDQNTLKIYFNDPEDSSSTTKFVLVYKRIN